MALQERFPGLGYHGHIHSGSSSLTMLAEENFVLWGLNRMWWTQKKKICFLMGSQEFIVDLWKFCYFENAIQFLVPIYMSIFQYMELVCLFVLKSFHVLYFLVTAWCFYFLVLDVVLFCFLGFEGFCCIGFFFVGGA